ncbi:AP-1 complex subunit [Musa troglodytarum]|uniref:Adaptor AP-1 19 kDa protein n=1 Tax=Musa troglodytarum TaxID=320322 RepID=A0A9E7EBR0_9LILI|nr:AP-1 complex subunit [Musa troglodytarum]
MEIYAVMSDAFSAAATQSLGLSLSAKLLLPRYSLCLSALDSGAPPAAVRSDPFRPAAAPRAFVRRTRRRTRRRSLTEGGGEDDGFSGDDGPFGGGGDAGGGGKGWNSGDQGPGWGGSSPSSSDPAFDFIYEVMCWIALSNCAHFAFKKMGRLLATRGKVFPLRLLPSIVVGYEHAIPKEILCIYLKIHFVLLISRQGKVRLTKWYSPYSQKDRTKVIRELSGLILARGPKLCNFVEWRGYKVVYRRYASLYFCMCIDADDNELEILEIIHHFVEILDRYFGSVCELDLIFNFHKAYYILDEILIAGELQESSKKTVARLIAAQDSLVEAAKEQASSVSNMIAQVTK